MKYIIKSIHQDSFHQFLIGEEVDMNRPILYDGSWDCFGSNISSSNRLFGVDLYLKDDDHMYFILGCEIEEAEYL